jgi:hypothetical protein
MNYKIKFDTLYTCDRYGNTIRKICDSEKEKIFVINYINGSVETRDIYGNRIRFICDGAVDVKFQESNIIVRTKFGNQLRDRNGNLIRSY